MIDSATEASLAANAQRASHTQLALLHGLGFAGFFGELGLPPGQFWSALIGFNLGVEIGQLSVILVAAIVASAVRRWLRDPAGVAGYRSWIVQPGSALIGLTGLWWGVTRLL